MFVGPRQTEYESTKGTIRATSTTQLSSSKKRRKHQPANVIAPSFAKFATGEAPVACSTTAATPKAAAVISSRGRGIAQAGSASQTKPNTAGITRNESHAIAPQSESLNHDSCVP